MNRNNNHVTVNTLKLGLPLGRAGYKRKALSTSFSVALSSRAQAKKPENLEDLLKNY